MRPLSVRDAEVTGYALAARTGDQAALESFIRSTQRDVWRFLAHVAEPALADDLAQETYLRALKSMPRFEGRAPARAWLLSIARRVAVDHVRRAQARPRHADVEDWLGLAESQESQQTRPAPGFDEGVALTDLLHRLDADRREAFVLTQMLDMSYAEAAEVAGCPVGTIRSRVARARSDLVTMLREAEDRTAAGR